VSADPTQLGAISSLTYQSLSTQTQEREFLDRLGRRAWLRELVEEGGSTALDRICMSSMCSFLSGRGRVSVRVAGANRD
jgi:hypothetical protein